MEKNSYVKIPVETYNELRDFKRNILENNNGIIRLSNGNRYYTESEAIKTLMNKLDTSTKKIENLELEYKNLKDRLWRLSLYYNRLHKFAIKMSWFKSTKKILTQYYQDYNKLMEND